MKTRLLSLMRAPSDIACPSGAPPQMSSPLATTWLLLSLIHQSDLDFLLFFVKNKLCNKNTWFTVFMLQSVLIFEVRILTQIYNPRWPPWRRIEDTLVFTPNPQLVLKMHCQHCATAMGVYWCFLPLSSLNWGPSYLPRLFFLRVSNKRSQPLCVDTSMPCKQQIDVWDCKWMRAHYTVSHHIYIIVKMVFPSISINVTCVLSEPISQDVKVWLCNSNLQFTLELRNMLKVVLDISWVKSFIFNFNEMCFVSFVSTTGI